MAKRLAGRLGLLFSSSLLTIVLLEIAARCCCRPPPIVEITMLSGTTERLAEENRSPLVGSAQRTPLEIGLFVPTPNGRRLRASSRVTIENSSTSGLTTQVITNSLGFRNREIGKKTRPRVLFLGDSITMAEYLPDEQCFVRLVESRSEQRAQPLETINAGVSGISLATELSILVESGIALEPDVVVVGFFLNDVADSPGVRILAVPRWLRRSWLCQYVYRALSMVRGRTDQDRELCKEDAARWFAKARKMYPQASGDPLVDRNAFYGFVLKHFYSWGHVWVDDPWRRLQPMFGELKRLSILHHFTPLVVCFPVRVQVEAQFVEDYPQRQLRRICAEHGLLLLDLLPTLRQAYQTSSEPLFYDDCHHTARGNDVIADRILPFILEQLRTW
ncbi:MAG: SGNH/GDSL hydrolase family protein [Planctomycetota bacterium]